jgi:hypothetical protein
MGAFFSVLLARDQGAAGKVGQSELLLGKFAVALRFFLRMKALQLGDWR